MEKKNWGLKKQNMTKVAKLTCGDLLRGPDQQTALNMTLD